MHRPPAAISGRQRKLQKGLCIFPLPKGFGGLRNGTTIDREAIMVRLTLGTMPAKMLGVTGEAAGYREGLEKLVLQAKGEINVSDAHAIDTAAACTAHAALCRWLMRHRLHKMSTRDIIDCSREMTKAKKDRDAAVATIGVDAPPPDPWEDLAVLQQRKA